MSSPFARLALLLSATLSTAHAATLTWLGDVSANWSSGTAGVNTNWTSNTFSANGDSLVFDLNTASVANLLSNNDVMGLTLGGTNALTFANDAGTGTGFTLTGNAITLGGNITSSGTTGTHTHTLSLGLILSGTRTLTAATGTTFVIDGTISESASGSGVIKSGAGAATLSGSSTFTGAMSVNQGTLTIGSIADSGTASAIGAGSAVNFGNAAQTGVLVYTGAGAATNRALNFTSSSTGGGTITNNGSGALIFTGVFSNTGTAAKTFTLSGSNTGANGVQAAINDSNGGALSVVKSGAGAWLLSGTSNFTGAVTVNQGTLTVTSIADSGTASAAGAGNLINLGSAGQAGILVYTGAGASTNRAVNLSSTGTGGGTITSNGSGALIFTGVFSNAGTGAKTFTLNGSNTGANEIQAAIGDSSGGALSLTKSGAGAWLLSGTSNFTGAVTVNQGTLAISSLADSGVDSAAGAGSVINLGSAAQTGTLIYTGSGASTNRSINLSSTAAGGGTITSNGSGALIFTGVVSNAGTGTGTKTLTLNGSNAGGNEVQGAIADGSGTLAVAKADAGTWTLSGLNTYSGGTTLSAGTLVVNSSSALGTGTLTITGGTLDASVDTTLGTNNAIALNGSLAFGGTNDLNLGTGVVTLGNANRDITLNGGSTLTMGEVQWNSAGGTRLFTVNQGTGSGAALVLGGFQLNVNADTAARNRTIAGTGNVTISGAVVNGNAFANGIIYSGSGTLTLAAVNGYTGTTIVNSGTLALSGGGSIGTSAGLTLNAGTFDVGGTTAGVGGVLTLGAAVTTVGGQTMNLISSVAGGSFAPGGNVTYNAGSAGFENGQATLSAGLVLTADRTITVNDSPNAAVDVLISGVISGSFGLTKGNGGTLLFTAANTYSGQSLLNNGVTQIYALGNTGTAGALGTGDKDATAGIIRFGSAANTGTLSYLGDGDSTNRRVQIGSGTGAAATGGATILSNGSGALVFTASTFNSAVTVSAAGASTARVLTLGGSSTDANTIQGAIINNTGAGTSGTNAVALLKQDAGLWILAGSSTYSGGTTVSGGTLVLNNSAGSATGSGSVSIGTGASLGGSGALSTSGTVTLQSGGTLFAGQAGVTDAQILTLRVDAGCTLAGGILLDLTGGGASGALNAQGGNNDLLVLNGGDVTLAGATLTIHTTLPVSSGAWAAGSSWKLFNWSGIIGRFDNLPDGLQQGNLGDLPDLSSLGLAWDWSRLYADGTLSITALATVPEPGPALLLLAGLSALLTRRGRRPSPETEK